MSQKFSAPVADIDDSRVTMSRAPSRAEFIKRQNEKFADVFFATLDGKALGNITSYLFFDLQRGSGVFGKDAQSLLSGARAWDRRAAEAAGRVSLEKDTANFGSNDRRIIGYALKHGLIDLLPVKNRVVSYGGGDSATFMVNEGSIIEAMQNTPDITTTDFWGVDIHPRYSEEQCDAASEALGLPSYAVNGDLRNGKLPLTDPEPGVQPIVMIFGGTFENVPLENGGLDAETAAAVAWGKMNRQHGLGAFVIKTYDGDQDEATQNLKYKPTDNFTAFELSAFARAVSLGLIKNPDYDILAQWELASRYNPQESRQEMHARCKIGHDLVTTKGTYRFEAGDDRMIFTLSHKWDQATHERIIQRAGGTLVKTFNQPGNPHPLQVVRFDREPDADIRKLIPY